MGSHHPHSESLLDRLMPRAYNVEIKARCADLPEARNRLTAEPHEFVGTDHQVDTYFDVPSGRLKLRQGTIETHLIAYHRPDQEGPKASTVSLYKPGDAEALLQTLQQTLPTLIVVDKQREIYFLDHVKVHLDRVDGLGSFVEVEAIGKASEHESLLQDCQDTMALLGVQPDALESASYSDMLLFQERAK